MPLCSGWFRFPHKRAAKDGVVRLDLPLRKTRESASEEGASGRNLSVCLASNVGDGQQLYNGLIYESCDVIASMGSATIVAPPAVRSSSWWRLAALAKRAATGLPLPPALPSRLEQNYDLFFYMCMRPDNLLALTSIKNWRQRSGVAAAFLWETWSQQAERYRSYLRLLDDFDHVFLFNPNSVARIQSYTSAKCSYLPAAVDCLSATPWPEPVDRLIDVYGMGRTVEPVHDQLVELTRRDQLFYLWDRGPGEAVSGYSQARLRTYHLIRRSRFFTSFNFRLGSKLSESGGEEAIPARVFEGTAGGAVLIGEAPDLPEYRELFDWPDALIKIPDEPLDMEAFYAELMEQPERIRRAGIVNSAQALRRHDWAYRWESILQTLGLPVPAGVGQRKQQLVDLARIAEASL